MWRKISSTTLFKHPRIVLVEDIVELPDGKHVPYLKYEEQNNTAAVLCIRGDNVLLQEEYSYPPNEVLYQFPGGKINTDETPIEAAARELAEEAGLKASSMHELGWFYTNNRRSSSKMFVYVATELVDVTKTGGDPEEHITSHWLPISEVEVMIRNGKIRNYSLLAAWALYRASLTNAK